MKAFPAIAIGDPQADRVVPPQGGSARLTVFVAAAMAFMAVITLALVMSASRAADVWADDLGQTATLRLPPADDMDEALASTIAILQETPGVVSARALSQDEQRALLAPWFGDALPIDALPIPQLVEIVTAPPDFDSAALRLRLSSEVPQAVLDDHESVRAPFVDAAGRLRVIGWIVLATIGATVAAMITLAAQASLAANEQVIRVLRLVGARDAYIARAFVRRMTLRALGGAVLGALAAVIVVQLMPEADTDTALFPGVGLSGLDWLWVLAVPLFSGGVAFAATRAAALAKLKETA